MCEIKGGKGEVRRQTQTCLVCNASYSPLCGLSFGFLHRFLRLICMMCAFPVRA